MVTKYNLMLLYIEMLVSGFATLLSHMFLSCGYTNKTVNILIFQSSRLLKIEKRELIKKGSLMILNSVDSICAIMLITTLFF